MVFLQKYLSTMQFLGEPGAEVSWEKTVNRTKERICLYNVRKATNQYDAQTEFFVCTSLQPFRLVVAFWWLVVFPWCVGGGDVMCGALVHDVIWFAAR